MDGEKVLEVLVAPRKQSEINIGKTAGQIEAGISAGFSMMAGQLAPIRKGMLDCAFVW